MACREADPVRLAQRAQTAQLGQETWGAARVVAHHVRGDEGVRYQQHVAAARERQKLLQREEGSAQFELVDMCALLFFAEEASRGHGPLPCSPHPDILASVKRAASG